MKKANLMPDGNKNTIFRLGFWGWLTILYCLLMFFLYVGMCNDGSNITAPSMAKVLGVENGVILNMNSLAGIVGVVFFIIIGQVNRKIGPRLTSGLCTIVAGVAYILAFNAPNLVMYCVAMCFVYGGIMSGGYVAGGTLVAKWFPKKKGIVMGYTTMGHNLASAFYVQIVSILIGPTVLKHIGSAVVPIGVAAIIIGILGIIFIRNNPHERDVNPDNVSDKVYEEEYFTAEEDDSNSLWTTGKLLKNKQLWLAAITTGFYQICSVGVMTQLVLRNVELGFPQQEALNIMTILALGGVFGSWLVGVIDENLGTKKTMIGFGIWYCIALVCNFTAVDHITIFVYISLFMIAMGIGGSANFTTSLPTSIFGRHEFDKVNSVIFPIQGGITALCFAVNGFVQLITGGQIRYAYLVFAGVAIVTVILMQFVDEYKYNKDRNSDINF